jgi:branched-chain amino acid transport system ATP-binding protein
LGPEFANHRPAEADGHIRLDDALALTVSGLTVRYGPVTAVSNLTLKVGAGEFHAVLGRNGAGKTSLLNAVSGLVASKATEVKVFGSEMSRKPASDRVAAGLVQVPEGRHCFSALTVQENLLVTLYSRAKAKRAGPSIDDIYRLFPRLEERRKQLAGSLSGGEQQMLALARGLLLNPRVLLLDEPSLGLAPKISAEFYQHLHVTQEAHPELALVVVEQRVREVLRHARSGVVIKRGVVDFAWQRPEDAPDPDDLSRYL